MRIGRNRVEILSCFQAFEFYLSTRDEHSVQETRHSYNNDQFRLIYFSLFATEFRTPFFFLSPVHPLSLCFHVHVKHSRFRVSGCASISALRSSNCNFIVQNSVQTVIKKIVTSNRKTTIRGETWSVIAAIIIQLQLE